jgi:2-polyprenyl-6-methoxyphenol hydroxylase-like FAD-dependent oxidoreductase
LSPFNVAIAGAGIGGLTLAAALRRRPSLRLRPDLAEARRAEAGRNVRVTVLERESDIRPAGAGLALGPNAIAALAHLGLADAIIAAGQTIGVSAILDSAGHLLGPEIDVAELAKDLGAPIVAIHRARLHEVLLTAAGRNVVCTSAAVVRYDARGDGVQVIGKGGERIDADLLVGADGLHSAVRTQLLDDGPPRYAGYTSWRGVTPSGAVATPSRMSESWGRGERFGSVSIGFGEIYWFAVADTPAGGSDIDVQRALLDRFGRWHDPIASIIESTPVARILRTDISDRAPTRCWHEGRVVLLGDAAHPMTPNLGQGAGQAIEDAIALDRSLAEESDLEAALQHYERRRVARANAIVVASRRMGMVAQLSHPVAAWLRDTAMRLTPRSIALAQARKLMRVGSG